MSGLLCQNAFMGANSLQLFVLGEELNRRDEEQMMKGAEMHDAICARGSVLCVHMITCMCMFLLARGATVSVGSGQRKSLRLVGGVGVAGWVGVASISQLFTQPLVGLLLILES